MTRSIAAFVLVAWAAGAGASANPVPEVRAETCPAGAIGTCTTYLGGNFTAAELNQLLEPDCASAIRSTTACPVSPLGTCPRTQRTDSEDAGITRTLYVYDDSGEWASSAALRCASGKFEGMSAPGAWRSAADDASASTRREATEQGPRDCGEPDPDLLAMTAAEVACESDEIHFGIHCEPAEAKLVAFTTTAMACESDDIQFGIRP